MSRAGSGTTAGTLRGACFLCALRRVAALAASACIALVAAAPAHGATVERPPTLALLPGFVTLESVQYAANTPANLTQPASGRADLAVTMGAVRVAASGVSFSNMVFDGAGQLAGVQFSLGQPLVVDRVAGCVLELAAGTFTWTRPGQLASSGAMTLRLPFRNPDGTPVAARVGSLSSISEATGTRVALGQITLQLAAGSNALRLPGLELTAAPMAWSGVFPASGAATWELTVPGRTRVALGIPGLASTPEFPVQAEVAGLRVDQAGKASFESAAIQLGTAANPLKLLPIQFGGLEIAVMGGRVSMQRGIPAFEGLTFDITLPEGITNAAGNGRAVLRGVAVDLSRGLLIAVEKQLRARIGDLSIDCASMVLDLSPLSALEFAEAPDFAKARPSWTGLWFRSGTLDLPIGGRPVRVDLRNFALDALGFTGRVSVARGIEPIELDGFRINVNSLSLEMLRNRLIGCSIAGGVEITLGSGAKATLRASIEHSASNGIAISIGSPDALDLGFGLRIGDLRGSYSQSERMLVLSGMLSMANPAFAVRITNFRIDANGVIYLPDEGLLTFPKPVEVDLGVIVGEFRRIGFNCSNGGRKVDSVTFTGTARFKSPIEGLNLGGEMDLEHVTIGPGTGGRPVDIEIGGLSIAAEIPELGTVGGSFGLRDDLAGFRGIDVLYGDANFNLTPLGASMGVAFLIAPEKQAWFVGGQAGFTPEIMVQLPSPGGPVPLFRIEGFLGGFGVNVAALAEGGIGPITKPADQLRWSDGTVLMQAGLMLSDYAGGDKLWWADTTLTATLNPVMLDLTARMAFLDLAGVSGFPSESQWRRRDNTARASMTLDLDDDPSFLLGADFDFNLPSKSFPVIEAEGEALMKFARGEKFVRTGYWWADQARERQRALSIRVGSVLEEIVTIEGKAGMRVDFMPDMSGIRTAEIRVDLDAKFKLVPLEGYARGMLRIDGLGGSDPVARGSLTVGGLGELGPVVAEVRGQIGFECSKRYLELEGKVYGRVGPIAGELDISRRLQ